MRRVTKREQAAEVITKLDAFPKTLDDAKETTSSGGAATVVAAVLIFVLVGSEIAYYTGTEIQYEYEVDREFRRNMTMHIDITIAMKCNHLGADYVDVSGNSSDETTRGLQMKATHFELAANQQAWLDETRRNNLAMGASGLDSLQRFLRAEHRAATLMPERDTWPDRDPDACRVVGTIPIAKVAANFHITAGKSIHHPRGHAHLAHVVPPNELNFSHRIDRLSFSDSEIGGHTLDGDLKVTQDGKMMYQYFIKVVPTSTKAVGQAEPFWANQYSVTEQSREVDHAKGASGLPGIFFKYDLEPLTVRVIEVRLCGIIGGVFATSGMLHQTISSLALTFKSSQGTMNLPSNSPTR